jgi:hypothetical protein
MGQERNWNFRDDDLTKRLNQWLMGVVYSGRFTGFDKDVSTAGTTLVLSHDVTGYSYNDGDNNPKPKVGVLISNSGVVIKEDSSISVTIQPNNTATDRVDTVYMSHRYLDGSVGGEQATYGVRQGAIGVLNDVIEIPVGYFTMPAGVTDTANGRWQPEKPPLNRDKQWNGQDFSIGNIALTGDSSVTNINSYEVLLGYDVTLTDGAYGVHEINIVLAPEQNLRSELHLFIVANENVLPSFSIKLSVVSDSSTEVLVLPYSEVSNSNRTLKIAEFENGEYRVVSADVGGALRSYSQNDFYKSSVYIKDPSLNSGLSLVIDSDKPSGFYEWRSDNLRFIQLTDSGIPYEPTEGTKILISFLNQSIISNGYVTTPTDDIDLVKNIGYGNTTLGYGSDPQYNYLGLNDASFLTIQGGNIVEFVYNSGQWRALGINSFNSIRGLDTQLKAVSDFNDNVVKKTLHYFSEPSNVSGVTNSDPYGLPIPNSILYIPNDGISRVITLVASANATLGVFANECDTELLLVRYVNASPVSILSKATLNLSGEGSTKILLGGLSLSHTELATNTNVQPNEDYYLLTVRNSGTASVTLDNIRFSLIGTPSDMVG